ncbi:hypothetical protein [Pseudomonas viridiflava]|uniref:hypothetical protein n=1 Tax=Pseudomonas viridiflava TaxID=33069 RepID=UPI0020C06436|nr:hypothetical protein [Pseudomonas viridiflava]
MPNGSDVVPISGKSDKIGVNSFRLIQGAAIKLVAQPIPVPAAIITITASLESSIAGSAGGSVLYLSPIRNVHRYALPVVGEHKFTSKIKIEYSQKMLFK